MSEHAHASGPRSGRHAILFGAVVAAAIGSIAGAQGRKTVWDGVYSPDQAVRGKSAFATNCVGCHGNDLAGLTGPELAGDHFRTKWDFQNVNQLFMEISTRMPRNNPATLGEDTYLDLVAYLLEANAFPAGTDALRHDPVLMASILIQKTKGAQPADLPTGTLAQVVGCLSPMDEGWALTSATAPVRTDNPDASKEEQRTALQQAPLGTRTIRLLGVFGSMDAHKGHKMEAKGLLVKDPEGDRLNVASLEMVGPTCMP